MIELSNFIWFEEVPEAADDFCPGREKLLVSSGCSSNERPVLGKLRFRHTVHHRVGILDTNAVGSVMALHNVHHGIVSVLVSPVALPLQHGGKRRYGFRSRLDDSLHRVVMSKLTHVAAAIFRDVNFVAVVNRLYGRQCDAGLGPQPGQDNLLPASLFNCSDEVLIVPGVHRGTFDGLLPWEYGSQLRPHIPAEGLRLDGG